jgi:hypothetical protein
VVFPNLNELQRREVAGAVAELLGRGAKPTKRLAHDLVAQGFTVSPRSVLRMSCRLGYRLKADPS